MNLFQRFASAVSRTLSRVWDAVSGAERPVSARDAADDAAKNSYEDGDGNLSYKFRGQDVSLKIAHKTKRGRAADFENVFEFIDEMPDEDWRLYDGA